MISLFDFIAACDSMIDFIDFIDVCDFIDVYDFIDMYAVIDLIAASGPCHFIQLSLTMCLAVFTSAWFSDLLTLTCSWAQPSLVEDMEKPFWHRL